MNFNKNPFELKQSVEYSDPPRCVPDAEIRLEFVRSSGPGGQKVNKTSSKAVLRWNVDASTAFTPEEKEIIKTKLANRINKAGELYLDSDRLRSQFQNRDAVIGLLQDLITEVLTPQTERKATRPTRSSKERRLDDKKRQGQKKQNRRWEE